MAKTFSVSDNNSKVQDSFVKRSYEYSSSNVNSNRKDQMGKQKFEIDFSPRLMAFIVLLLAGIFYANQLLVIVMFVFFGFAVMSAIRPIVSWLMGRSMPKGLSITISYIILFLLIQAALVLVFVPFLNQVGSLIAVFPTWIDEALGYLEGIKVGGFTLETNLINQYITDLIKSFPTADNVKNVAGFLSNFFSTGAFLLTSIVFSVYLVSEHDSFFDILLIRIVSDEKRERVRRLVLEVEGKLGSWVLGQGVVSTLVSIFSVILLTLLGVPFAFPLAILTGFLGVIPSLGSTLSSVLIALIALITGGPIKALIVIGAFVIYQMIENSVITPKVMGNAVGLKPIVVMLGVIVFLTLFGVVGGFVAVPLMVIMKILYEFYIDLQKLKAKGIV